MCWFYVYLIIEKSFKQTLFFRCFTNIDSVFLHDLTSEKIGHYVLSYLLCWFGLLLVIEDWFNHTYCVRYFTKIHFLCFTIRPVTKTDTLCYLTHCVGLWYIFLFNSGLSRHTMLAISQILVLVLSIFYHCINQTLCVG